MRLGVSRPVRVNRSAGMVLGGVIVRVRVYERSAQAGSLDGYRKRYGEYFPHGALILRDPAHGVKADYRRSWLSAPEDF